EELVNRRQFYVSVSRAVEDARVYTDDRAALARVVSREQVRESALQVADRLSGVARARPVESRTAALKRETALSLVDRSSDERKRGGERADGRALGGPGRGESLDRGAHAPGRGAEGPAGPSRGASSPE